ncbi:hypothetical protein SANTM175S_02503 [Streptomyces antimycoticus]
MTARPPSGQHPSDEGPGHPPAATTGPAVPGVPPTFLPGHTGPRPRPERRAERPAPGAPGAGSVPREDAASAESAGVRPAPHRESPDSAAATADQQEAADRGRPGREARVSYGAAPVPRAPRADQARHASPTARPSRRASPGGPWPGAAGRLTRRTTSTGSGPRPRSWTRSGGGC